MDEVGQAVTDVPVVLLNPAEGDQTYVTAPETESVAHPPMQMLVNEGVIVAVAAGLTVTGMLATSVHAPFETYTV